MMYTAVGLFATGVALDVISLASDLLPAKFGLSMASKVAGKVLSVSNKLPGNPNSGLGGLVSKYVGNAFGFLSGLVGPLFIFGIILAIVLPLYPFFGFLRSEEHTSELQSLMRISYA